MISQYIVRMPVTIHQSTLPHIHLIYATHLITSLDMASTLQPPPFTLGSPNSIEEEDSPAQHKILKLSQMS
jgi:hypothetical protein